MVHSRLRFDLNLLAIPKVTEQIRVVLHTVDDLDCPDVVLKGPLLDFFTANPMDLCLKLIFVGEPDYRRPSKLMETIMAQLPSGEC